MVTDQPEEGLVSPMAAKQSQAFLDALSVQIPFESALITQAKSSYLIDQNASPDHIYRFKSGKAYITLHSANGQVKVLPLKKGAIIGKAQSTSAFDFSVYCERETQFETCSWQDISQSRQKDLISIFEEQAHQLHVYRTLILSFERIDQKVSPKFLESIIRLGKFHHLDENEVLFHQGDTTHAMYFLLSGKLDVYVGNSENLTRVGEIFHGQPFGEMSLFSGESRSATIVASRCCELVSLSREVFDKLSNKFPELNTFVVKSLIERVRKQNSDKGQKTTPSNRLVLFLSQDPAISGTDPTSVAARLQHQLKINGANIITKTVVQENFPRDYVDKVSPAQLTDLLETLEQGNIQNIYFSNIQDTEWTKTGLGRSDELWLIVSAEDHPDKTQQSYANLTHLFSWKKQSRKLILAHNNAAPITKTSAWTSVFEPTQHFHLRLHSVNSLGRIARYLTDTSRGLILGGGGARGLAQVGVLRALEEANHPIDWIGGTSIGSIIGGWTAMGLDSLQIQHAVNRFFVSVNPLGDYTLPLISLSRSQRLNKLLKEGFGIQAIEDLSLPYFCVSSDMSTAEEKHHEQGLLWRAIRASIAIPGIIAPVIDNGHYLVDGGLLNNLPCDLMRTRNKGPIIAVDVSPSQDCRTELRSFPSPWKVLWHKLTGKNAMRIPSIFETLLRSSMLSSTNRQQNNRDIVDMYIQPDINGISMLDFKSAEKAFEAGYQETVSALQKI